MKAKRKPFKANGRYTKTRGGTGSYSKARPTRFKSPKNYLKSRVLSTVLNTVGETKLNALEVSNARTPDPQALPPAVGPVYQTNYCLGQVPVGYLNFNALGGFEWALGTGPNDRIGKYMYLKKTTVNLKISLNDPGRGGQTRFRVLVYKSRRNNTPGQYSITPGENLFLNEVGLPFGTDTSVNANDATMKFQTAIVNKRNYQVVRDFQFVLTPSSVTVQGGSNLVSPLSQGTLSEKHLRFQLGHYKKTSFNPNTDRPDDLNYQYLITILSFPVGSTTSQASAWTSSIRGTVSAGDN
jgi:hypothetical protein